MRGVRRTAFASARWERQTGVRGVPSTKASAVAKVILTLSASSRQLSFSSEILSRSSVKVVVDEFLAGDSVWTHFIDIADETRDGNDAG